MIKPIIQQPNYGGYYSCQTQRDSYSHKTFPGSEAGNNYQGQGYNCRTINPLAVIDKRFGLAFETHLLFLLRHGEDAFRRIRYNLIVFFEIFRGWQRADECRYDPMTNKQFAS